MMFNSNDVVDLLSTRRRRYRKRLVNLQQRLIEDQLPNHEHMIHRTKGRIDELEQLAVVLQITLEE